MHNPRNESSLSELLKKYEHLINKTDLNGMHAFNFCPTDNMTENIKIFEIEKLTEPMAADFFSFVLKALGDLKEVFGYIIQSSRHKVRLYVGLKYTKNTGLEILKSGLKNSYPYSKIRELSQKDSSLLLMQLFNAKNYRALSSAVVIPNNTSLSNAPINQKLIDLMGNEDFVAFFLASAINWCKTKALIEELKQLYTKLSSFSKTDYSFSHSVVKNTASHITKSTTENNSTTCTNTNGTERGYNTSEYTLITPSATVPFQETRLFTISLTLNEASSSGNLIIQSSAKGEVQGCATTHADLNITSTTITNSNALSYTNENKSVIDHLEKLERVISRLTAVSNEAMFYFGAYFMAASSATSIRAAYTYSGLAKDKTLNIEDTFVTTWEKGESIFQKLVEELGKFNHLNFMTDSPNRCVTTCTPITCAELLNSFYFPYSNSSHLESFLV